jgi:predicted O-linked N-acetylglucosamine transferase (SPINDLY family)
MGPQAGIAQAGDLQARFALAEVPWAEVPWAEDSLAGEPQAHEPIATVLAAIVATPPSLGAPTPGTRGARAEPHLLRAEQLRADGARNAAIAAYEAALDADPTNPGALIGLAELLLQQREAARAQLLLLRCCGVAPTLPLVWALLGFALRATGDSAEAETAFGEALRLEPDHFGYALNRIEAAKEAGHGAEELARLEVASLADPLDAVLLTARGALLARLARIDEAIDVLETAVLLAPEEPCAALELANALVRSQRNEAAEAALSRAIELVPDTPVLRSSRAVLLMRLHRHREGVAELRAVMEVQGPRPQTLCNLSTALTSLGEQDEAVEAAWQATRLAPHGHLPWRSLLNAMAYQDGADAARMLAIARRAAAEITREAIAPFPMTADPHRRIRIGLLSQTLRSHPVGWLTIAGFENLDPAAFEIVCIGQAPTADPIERRFRAIAAQWHVVENVQRDGFVAGLRALGLDMLIELSGYGDRGMMTVCANRVAPVQVKWVGMQNHSTGIPEIDWFITDRWETPPELEHLYCERMMRLADGYVVYSPPPYAPDIAKLPALRRGHVTFGCFHNIAKVTPRVIATWAEILLRVPTARLVLKTHQVEDAETRARVLACFAAAGVGLERLDVRGGSSHRVLLRHYDDIDIVLDPFPYVGGLTTCEALWMGVPTITMPGQTFSSRHATSHMSNVGLADWVAPDRQAYVDMAVRRAGDIEALAALREGLRARVKASPLCDGPRFGRNLGRALRDAWQDWCARQASLDLAAGHPT